MAPHRGWFRSENEKCLSLSQLCQLLKYGNDHGANLMMAQTLASLCIDF